MSPQTIGPRLLTAVDVPLSLQPFFTDPDPGDVAWSDLVASVPGLNSVRRRAACMALFVLLDRQHEATPEDLDDLLIEGLGRCYPHTRAELAAHLLPLFEPLPPARRRRLRHALVLQGVKDALSNFALGPASWAAFKDEALALVK